MSKTKEEVVALLVEPNAFHTWLKEKDPTELVGMGGDALSCPVARFLKESGAVAYVHPDHVAVYTPQNSNFYDYILHKEDIGSWVQQFIYHIDEIFPGNVTATSALEVLNDLVMD